jgi:hypothetical protein
MVPVTEDSSRRLWFFFWDSVQDCLLDMVKDYKLIAAVFDPRLNFQMHSA